MNTYEEVIEELFAINFLGDYDHTKPYEMIAKITNHECRLVMDPKVSGVAVKLIEDYGGVIDREYVDIVNDDFFDLV